MLASDPDRVRGAAREVGDGGGPPEVHQHEHLPGQGRPLVLAQTQVNPAASQCCIHNSLFSKYLPVYVRLVLAVVFWYFCHLVALLPVLSWP